MSTYTEETLPCNLPRGHYRELEKLLDAFYYATRHGDTFPITVMQKLRELDREKVNQIRDAIKNL